MIREHVPIAALFADWVRAEPAWEVCAPHPFSVVCLRHDGDDAHNDAIMERVNRTGEVFVSGTKLYGWTVIRLAIGNARSTEADVGRAWELLRREPR